MTIRRALACSFALATMLAGTVARADDEGIKIGDGRLHPFINLGGRWDSFASVDANGNPVSDFLFDIDPGLKLNIPSSVLGLSLNADVDEVLYATYTGLDRTLINGDLALDFFNEGAVGVKLEDRFQRGNNPTVSDLPFAVISDLNDASAKVPIRPGGGAFIIQPGYDFIYQHFENFTLSTASLGDCAPADTYCNPALANDLDYIEHRGSLDVIWRFLPKTAVLLSGEFINMDYLDASAAAGNAPLSMFDATLGLSGLLTSHFEVVAKAGYAQTLLNDATPTPALLAAGDAHTVVGQLQLGYLFSETGSIRVGFTRVLVPTPTQLAYYEDNRPYLQVKLLFGRLSLHLDASLDIDTFASNSEGTGSRTDLLLHIDVGPEVEIFRWFRVGAGYDLTSLGSDATAAFSAYTGVSPVLGNAGYTNNEVYLRLTFVY